MKSLPSSGLKKQREEAEVDLEGWWRVLGSWSPPSGSCGWCLWGVQGEKQWETGTNSRKLEATAGAGMKWSFWELRGDREERATAAPFSSRQASSARWEDGTCWEAAGCGFQSLSPSLTMQSREGWVWGWETRA